MHRETRRGGRRIPRGNPDQTRFRRGARQSRQRPAIAGELDEAVAADREAIRLEPDLAIVHHNLGTALKLQAKAAEAVDEFRQAVRIDPNDVDSHSNLGNTLEAAGTARRGDRRTPRRDPARSRERQHPLHSRHDPCRPGEAGGGDRRIRATILIKPDFAAAHCNLGIALKRKGSWPRQPLNSARPVPTHKMTPSFCR